MPSAWWPTSAPSGAASTDPETVPPDVPSTAPPRPTSHRRTRATGTSWWEDPHLSLHRLTPGQRYTMLLVAIVTVLILSFGLPHEPSVLRGGVASSRTTPSAGAVAPSVPGAGSQVPASPSDLGSSNSFSFPLPSFSSAFLNPLPEGTASVPAASGSNPPGASGSTAPSPASTCPVSPPATGTPIDTFSGELITLCEELAAQGSGTVPAGTLPGGVSSPAFGGAESATPGAITAVRDEWAFVDSPNGTSGVSDPKWPSPLSAEMTGTHPTVTVGLLQSSAVSNSLVSTLGRLVKDGALVQVLLVPRLNASGGPEGFGSWVAQELATLKPVELVEIGTGGAPTGSSASNVAAYTAAGLAAARGASATTAAGVLWLDGGTSSDDGAVWSALASSGAWSSSSFMARSLDASTACSSKSGFSTMERQHPVAAALPVVSEVVPDSAPTTTQAPVSSCMKSSIAQEPAAWSALWRLWQGPAS